MTTAGKRNRTMGSGRAAGPEDQLGGEIAALVRGEHGNPFGVLGPHEDADGKLVVRCFIPGAMQVTVLDEAGAEAGALLKIHPEGVFAGPVALASPRYRLRVQMPTGTVDLDDPYRFPTVLGDMDVYLLAEGNHLRLYEKLGAQPAEMDGVSGATFAVWAPNARRVSVVGDFNGWDGRRHPMRRRVEAGLWEIFLPGVEFGAIYKYEIIGPDERLLPLKADPVAFQGEQPPRTASVIHGPPRHSWSDHDWMAERQGMNARSAPISIYECHLGSWMREVEEGGRYLTYTELAERLVPYVKDMGFTHIELLPISEFPFDGSWGYQPIGLYAPTSRFGTPEAFCGFVEACHEAELGLVLDWVPAHFPTDPHGLAFFDGTHLYEHADPRLGRHLDWDTLIYNFGRREVANFLLANAMFWLDRYHIDGLRVDAVASMLYLDYSRQPGEWIPNEFGGNENLAATAFIRRLNELTYGNHEGAVTVAEESTAWPAVTRPTYVGGLGFGYKWNMGWMHDTLRYMSKDPVHRHWHHNDMTFGLLYAFTENFILPLSHDEVVHGKGSLIGKMPGDRWQRFANLRAYFGFMFAHPGKKLLFMGGEFAQEREWNHDASLDWHLLDQPEHSGVQSLVRDLNSVYRSLPALHERDCEGDGFEWIEASDSAQSVFAFLRRGSDPDAVAVSVSNFTPVPRQHYRLGVPLPGYYKERVNTDSEIYGGGNMGNGGGVMAENIPAQGRAFSILLTLPPLATLILERRAA
jgi:1,4-alpha-glucan branching enzyme